MSALSFLGAPWLWGLALVSIPVIIHLLFRRRFRRVEWAPMRYLKLAIERHRRRIRLEQLLLLLLRMAVIAMLFLALARPLMHAHGWGSWLGGSLRGSQLVILDDSLSMGYIVDGRSALDRAKTLASSLFESFGPKDRLSLVLASKPEQPLLREVVRVSSEEVRLLIDGIEPTGVFVSWLSTLQALDGLVSSGVYPLREVTLITDLRGVGWSDELADLASGWTGQNVNVRIMDVGSRDSFNVTLEDFKLVDRLTLVNTPTRIEAHVHNTTGQEIGETDAELIVDGKASTVRLPVLPPGDVTRVPLYVTLGEAGDHRLSLKLPDDAMDGDNQRWLIVHAKERMNVVLVDGEPSADPLGGEADFLALALSTGFGQGDGFHIGIATDTEWDTVLASDADLIALTNVT